MRHLLLILIFFGVCAVSKAQTASVSVYDSLSHELIMTYDVQERMDILKKMIESTNDVSSRYISAYRLYKLAQQVGDLNTKAHATSIISHTYLMDNDYEHALAYAFESLELYHDLDSLRGVATVYNQIAAIYANKQNYDKALGFYWRAVDISKVFGFKDIELTCVSNVGDIYMDMGLQNIAIDTLLYIKKNLKGYSGPDCDALLANTNAGLIEAFLARYHYYNEQKDLNAAYNIMKSLDMEQIEDTDIFVYLNCCTTIPKIYLEKYKLTHKKAYLDTALTIVNNAELKGCDNGISYFDDNHIINKCNILMAKGMYNVVPQFFRQYDTSFTPSMAIVECKKNYYLKMRDYKNALIYSQLYTKMLNNQYSISFASRSEYLTLEKTFKEKITVIENQRLLSQRGADLKKKNYRFGIFGFAFLGLLIVSVVVHILHNNHQERKINKELKQTNLELSEMNLTLQKYQELSENQYREIEHQTAMLAEQGHEIQKVNKFLVNNLDTGQKIQQAVVPSIDAINQMFGDGFVMWRPLNIVSGDFYWAAQRRGRKFLIVADCTGHGVPGAMLSILGTSLLNHLLPMFSMIDASQILELFKEKFLETIANQNIDDGMDLALMVLEGNRLQYAGANRPLLIIRKGEVLEYKPTKICIGHNRLKEDVRFQNNVIDLEHGDMLYAYSDGITDQFGGDDGHSKFGNKQLKTLLSTIYGQNAQVQQSNIESRIDQWRNVPFYDRKKVPQLDDQLIVGIRVLASDN